MSTTANRCPTCNGELELIGSVRYSLRKATQEGELYACPTCRKAVERITRFFDFAQPRTAAQLEALRVEEQEMMRAAKAAWVAAHPKPVPS